jgi:hypothetical protein
MQDSGIKKSNKIPPKTKIRGACDPKFSWVKEVFQELFGEDKELGAGVACTIDGRLVVDLWGGFADPEARVGFG